MVWWKSSRKVFPTLVEVVDCAEGEEESLFDGDDCVEEVDELPQEPVLFLPAKDLAKFRADLKRSRFGD